MQTTQEIWILVVEVLVEPGDLPSGSTRAFTTITTWAESAQEAQEKLSAYLDTFNWKVLEVEQVQRYSDAETYQESLIEMIEQTKGNPQAIILGEFHTYKPE
jgi:hypothetical protein